METLITAHTGADGRPDNSLEFVEYALGCGADTLEVDVRRKYNVNILGVKSGDEIVPLLNPEYRFQPDAHLIVAGDKEAGIRLMDEEA